MLKQANRTTAVVASCLLAACGSSSQLATIEQQLGLININSKQIDEASGLAHSPINPSQLWLHNDSGDGPHLYAVDGLTGELLQTVIVEGAKAQDWEDMAAYHLQNQSWLVVGDIGDNRARRTELSLYGLQEPTLESQHTAVSWQIRFRYQDGPRDAEALAVDTQEQTLYLLSKRDQPPRLYRIPLSAKDNPAVVTAEWLGNVNTLPSPSQQDLEQDPKYGKRRSWPTAMDISPDGHNMLIVTYKDAYLYTRQSNETWVNALARQPQIIDLPQLRQTEAGGFKVDAEGKLVGLWAASEKLPAQLYYQRLVAQPVSQRTAQP